MKSRCVPTIQTRRTPGAFLSAHWLASGGMLPAYHRLDAPPLRSCCRVARPLSFGAARHGDVACDRCRVPHVRAGEEGRFQDDPGSGIIPIHGRGVGLGVKGLSAKQLPSHAFLIKILVSPSNGRCFSPVRPFQLSPPPFGPFVFARLLFSPARLTRFLSLLLPFLYSYDTNSFFATFFLVPRLAGKASGASRGWFHFCVGLVCFFFTAVLLLLGVLGMTR